MTSCWNRLPEEAGDSLTFWCLRNRDQGPFWRGRVSQVWVPGLFLGHLVAFDTKVRLVGVPAVVTVPDWVGDRSSGKELWSREDG